MKVEIDTLTGVDLNRAVALSLGRKVYGGKQANDLMWGPGAPAPEHDWLILVEGDERASFAPLPDYLGDVTQGWAIVADKDIDLFNTHTDLGFKATLNIKPFQPHLFVVGYGKTRMEAALRALVRSVYGETIELEEP